MKGWSKNATGKSLELQLESLGREPTVCDKQKGVTCGDMNTKCSIWIQQANNNEKYNYGWCCPHCITTLDKHLLGAQVAIYWEADDMFYFGTINGYDSASKSHRVLYDDMEWEFVDLTKECVFYNFLGMNMRRELGIEFHKSATADTSNEYCSTDVPVASILKNAVSPVSSKIESNKSNSPTPLKRKLEDDESSENLSSSRRKSSRGH